MSTTEESVMSRSSVPWLALLLAPLAAELPASAQERIDVRSNATPPPVLASPAGSQTHSASLRKPSPNPLRVALLRWWDANQSEAQVDSASQPSVLAFDGRDMWVGCEDGRLEEIQTNDVTLVGRHPSNVNLAQPGDIAFDGEMIWITSKSENTVTRARASDGVTIMYLNAGGMPVGLAFDGQDMWIASRRNDWVMRVHAEGMSFVATYPVTTPEYVAFDGQDVWVTSRAGGTVTKLSGIDGANLGTFPVGALPERLAFDGSSMWVVNSGSHDVTRLRVSDGAVLGTFPVGTAPHGICFDGANVWVANTGSDDVTLLSGLDGSTLGTFPAGDAPRGLAFDGANVWVANRVGKTVRKL
jgi:outer membrane lipoprotein-sorting protein